MIILITLNLLDPPSMQWMMHHDNRLMAFNSFTAFVHSNRSFRNCCWLRSQQFLPSSNTLQNTSGLSFSSSKNYYRKKKEHKCATQPKRNLNNLKRISGFSGGGLYSSRNGLLLIVYDWLLPPKLQRRGLVF